jgi:hypothetical protein
MELITPSYGLLIWTLLNILALTLMLSAVFSILKNDFKDSNSKLTWLIGSIFLPIVGPILYFQKKNNLVQK